MHPDDNDLHLVWIFPSPGYGAYEANSVWLEQGQSLQLISYKEEDVLLVISGELKAP